MRRLLAGLAVSVCAVLAVAAPAAACGGLVAPNGTVRLLRTATLAAYHDGVEHYVTSFQFAGSGGAGNGSPTGAEFGSIIPLPGIPSKVERAGSWTLQRLQREVQPRFEFSGGTAQKTSVAAGAAVEILKTKIDALDITILQGGGDEVGLWAKEHGFALTPDAPAVLDFYGKRSPIFMAARFDAAAARAKGQEVGDGTPIDLTIPTPAPWVPLRILGLGRGELEPIEADVFLLTDNAPAMLPVPDDGMSLNVSQRASDELLTDLRNDKNMEWIPTRAWLSYLRINTTAGRLTHDLAVDGSGAGRPSAVAAGIRFEAAPDPAPLRPKTIHIGSSATGTHAIQWALILVSVGLVAFAVAKTWPKRLDNG
jgi:hypothetical protein